MSDPVGRRGRLGRFLRPHRWLLALILILAACEVSLDGCLTIGYKLLIDHALQHDDTRAMVIILVVLAVWWAIVAVLSVQRDWLYARLTVDLLGQLRRRLFEHCQRLAVGYYERHTSGQVLARFSTDLAGVEALLTSAASSLLLPLLSIVMGLGLLFYFLSWPLALLGAAVWPVVVFLPRLLAPRATTAEYQRQQAGAALLGTVGEALATHRVSKVFGLASFSTRRFEQSLAPLSLATRRSAFLSSLVERSTVLGIYAVQIGAVAAAALLVHRGLLSLGTFVAFVTVFWNLGWSLVVFARAAPGLVGATGSFRRLSELLDEPVDPLDEQTGVVLPPFQAQLQLSDVQFGYPDGPAVLCGVSLTVHHGEFVAVVGPSGSGKSTLLGLLARFYAPTVGAVVIDGVELGTVDARAWRGQLGLVMQESVLFNTTVRENLRLGRPGLGDDELFAAARQAEVHEAILTLPDGYETVVGERGGLLSGGQRQRLALARALAGNPQVLLLDEVASSLDAVTAAAISQTLARAGTGRTTIAVTHQLASVASADRVFVLERGRIVEQGTPAELLARDGLYASMWRRQSGFALSADGSAARVEPSRLRDIPLLRNVPEAQLAALATRFASLQVSAGQVVFAEGSLGDLFYLIAQGQVVVSRRIPGGGTTEVARLATGDEFGELALLTNAPRNATVTARTDCLFLTLTRRSFRELLETVPAVRAEVEALAQERRGPV